MSWAEPLSGQFTINLLRCNDVDIVAQLIPPGVREKRLFGVGNVQEHVARLLLVLVSHQHMEPRFQSALPPTMIYVIPASGVLRASWTCLSAQRTIASDMELWVMMVIGNCYSWVLMVSRKEFRKEFDRFCFQVSMLLDPNSTCTCIASQAPCVRTG